MTAATAADLELSVRNAAALWTALAESRGNPLLRRPGFLTVVGDARAGLRILLLDPDPAPDDRAELAALVRRRTGPVVVEDQYAGLDLTGLGLTPRTLPVMIRRPGPVPGPALPVTPVERPDQLAVAEDVVVHGFPLEAFQPHRPGRAFPAALLDRPEVRFFLLHRDGTPAGACLTVRDEGVGLYWMTSLPEHRSRGVGRALLHGVLGQLGDVPMTLTAARAGRPLYDSLGFVPVTEATWWG
ncbi:GNAT family N-acetyltransferase [Micromonospora soli]|uniref:GNAT family N-acetyltransferase n=1 Tax=Micromonospora sp. NBRC 110009 TaxID=3061627 RepID=UPI0026727165|nr:GNAT family N-acetyltransferase [Micromonospora sp. NBRC 110009]WKT99487.1 GNAT family N-acetyltransferase [Micromonospora sp. NBRC 110009]